MPTTAQHFVYELQQDWDRQETYQGVVDIMKAHTAYGTQIFFSKWALGGHDSALKAASRQAHKRRPRVLSKSDLEESPMTQRLDYTAIAPAGIKALGSVYGYIVQSGLHSRW